MHGVAILHEHIVGDIYNIVDGPHAHHSQPSLHPHRGRFDDNVLHNAAAVPGAKLCIFHGDRGIVCCIALAGDVGQDRLPHSLPQGRSRFSSKADNTVAVGAVGQYRKVKDHIVPPQSLGNIHAQGRVCRKDQDTVYAGSGEFGFRQVKFLTGAEHAVAFHSADVGHGEFLRTDSGPGIGNGHHGALKYVFGIGQDLSGFVPQIHLAYGEFIGIGMGLHFQDLSGNDAGNPIELLFITVQFKAPPHHFFNEFLVGNVKVYIFTKP